MFRIEWAPGTAGRRSVWKKVRPEDRERTPERMGEALRNNYQQHNNTLLKYQPKIELVFDDAARPGMLRQRLCISLQWEGKELSLYGFIQELQTKIELTAALLEEKDRELFENILAETISHKLRARIEGEPAVDQEYDRPDGDAENFDGIDLPSGLEGQKAEGVAAGHRQLVRLLNKDRALLTQEDSQQYPCIFARRSSRPGRMRR